MDLTIDHFPDVYKQFCLLQIRLLSHKFQLEVPKISSRRNQHKTLLSAEKK